MGDVALAAVVNLPALAEKLLAADGSSGAGDSAAQAAKPALLSAAAALASAASALAGSGKEQAAGAAAELAAEAGAAAAAAGAADVPSAADVQALLEDEINAMNRLLDGRWGEGVAGCWARFTGTALRKCACAPVLPSCSCSIFLVAATTPRLS